MRRRIALVTFATTSAIVLAFLIPLGLLVQVIAEDRGMQGAEQEARSVAILVSGLHDDPQLDALVRAVDDRGPAVTSVLEPDGTVIGSQVPELAEDAQVERARGGEAFSFLDDGGGAVLVPVVTEDGISVVRSFVPRDQLASGVGRAWLSISVLGVLLLAAAVGVAYRLGKRVSTPVTDLAAVAHRLRDGELDARAEPTGPPETVELGLALNRLASRITDLLAAERAAVGDLSHRLRTPVTALRLDAEQVQQQDVSARLQEHVGQLQRTIDAVVHEARRPVRTTMGASSDATEVVRERARFWSALAEDQGRAFEAHLPTGPHVVGLDATDLRDIVDILVDNVFAHTPEETPFTLEVGGDGPDTLLTVTDEGPGIQEPEGGHRPGSSGLGLQIVHRTLAAVGGRVDITTDEAGTRIEVRIPPPRGRESHGPQSS